MMKKKALLVSSNRWNSAITEYLISTAHALQSRGWQVQLLIPTSPIVVARCQGEKLAFLAWKSISVSAYFEYRRLVASWQPNWIMGFGGPESWLLWMTPKKQGVRLTRFIGYSFSAPISVWIQRRFFLSFDSVLFPCESLRTACTWVEDLRKHSVPLGLSSEKFFPIRTEPSWQKNPVFILFGRLDPIKGHGKFLALFAQFLTRLRTTSLPLPILQIVGKPANTTVAELETIAQGLGISAHVAYKTEQVENVAALLSQACMGIVCSVGSELICRVAQEFLLCGTPIFVSNVGALPEVLFPKAGACYPLENEVETLSLLLQQYTLRLQESLATRQQRAHAAKSRFSFDTMGLRLESI
jgi:glycosyltransferase involved in cell wall biosynthesis